MRIKARKLIWSVPLVAVFAVVGALALFVVLAPNQAAAQDEMLGPPTGLTATADGQGMIKLSWMAPSAGDVDVTAYRIDFAEDAAGVEWEKLVSDDVQTDITTMGDTSKYTDGMPTALMPGTKRYYRVFAIYGGKGEGAPSAVANATTDPVKAPGNPTGLNLIATVPTANTINLVWTAPTANGGSAVTGYKIERSENGTTWMTLKANTGMTTTSYVDMKLMAGKMWYYRVSAINKAGTGMPSDPMSAMTATANPPAAPTGLTAQGSNAQVMLHWLAPADPDGAPVKGYKIERSVDGNSWEVVASTGTRTSYSVGGAFSSGTTPWQYRVSAMTSADTGVVSAALEVGPPVASTHGQVKSLKAMPMGPTTIRLTWMAGTGSADGHRIDYSMDGLVWRQAAAGDRSVISPHDDDNLKVGDKRYYRVIAMTGNDLHHASNMVSATVGPAQMPGAPTGAAIGTGADAPTADTITIEWIAPTEIGGSAITGYKIERGKDNITWMTLKANTGMTTTTYMDKGLVAGSTWYYRVRAINAAGAGNASSAVTGMTMAADPLGIPSGLVAVARGMSRVDLYWLMTDDPKGAPVTGYKIEVTEDDGGIWTTVHTDTGSRATTYSLTGLTDGTARTYRVSAINSVGVTAPSLTDMAIASTGTPPMLMPSKPTGVVVSSLPNTQSVSVTWDTTSIENAEQIKVALFNSGVTALAADLITINPANDAGSDTFSDVPPGTYYVVVASFRTGMKHVLSDLKMVTVQ